MQFTHNAFDVEWKYDKNIFNDKPLNIPIIPYLGAGHIIGATKDNEGAQIPLILLGVQWVFELLHNNKPILKYVVKDEYWTNAEDRKNDNEDLDKMIRASYDKVCKEFDRRKLVIQIFSYQMPPLDQMNVVVLRKELLEALKSKGY
jgi:hypothetical protein